MQSRVALLPKVWASNYATKLVVVLGVLGCSLAAELQW
jgi:hypothetical protein